MSVRVAEQVENWDSRSFAGGYGELSRLADAEFSGAIRADGAELFMTKGVVVGVQSGTIERFEAAGTAYEAPSPALPLLAVMQDRSDEVRAKYYTEKTSISAVDQTLSDGGFTGFVVLSENVLSGEYYLVYHAGRSMSVAFVGESERLLTGEEAFETADDEVGLYEVRPVEIDPVEIPEPDPEPESEPAPDPDPPLSEGQSGVETGAQTDPGTGSDVPSESGATPARSDQRGSTSGHDGTDGASAAPTDTEPESRAETAPTDTSTDDSEPDTDSGRGTDSDHEETRSSSRTKATAEDDRRETAGQDDYADSEQATSGSTPHQTDTQTRDSSESRARSQPQQRSRDPVGGTPTEPGPPVNANTTGQNGQSEVDAGLETIAVPSIDPSRTQTKPQRQPSGQSRQSSDGTPTSTQTPPQSADTTGRSAAQTETRTQSEDQSQPADPAPDPERVAELEATLEDRAKKIERLESALSEATEERDQLREQLGDLEDERAALTGEIDRLEDELATLEDDLGAQTDAERRLSPGEALAGTDLFVRYESKGDTTLAKAHDGTGRRSDVVENLRLETHTQFDAQTVSVGGETYEAFFTDTAAYQFAQWLIQDLLFEIRSTGSETALQTLYDAIPEIDRVEFAGTVEVTQTENGQETRTDEEFDLVFRNRMGEPLVATNLNDSLEAASEGMMEELLTAARRIGQSSDTFAGAFLVTTSFFEPGALETASEATKSGFLSRDKRASYVTLSRSRGFHLCLVEARDQKFNLAVPEL